MYIIAGEHTHDANTHMALGLSGQEEWSFWREAGMYH